jgi:cytoskeleton protein RodZ
VEVELRIVEYSWLRVIVDGEEVFAGSLEEGTTRTWRGRESIALRCGNAGGVEATVNGEPLGILGERGQVVDLEWLAEGVTTTPATPEVTVTLTQ